MALRFRILATAGAAPSLNAVSGSAVSGDVAGPVEERSCEIVDDRDEVRLGRQPGLEIELPFSSVSTVHARITRGQAPGDWWVEDLDSRNGTWLDGARLVPRRPSPLRAGQRLRVATVEVMFDGWSATARGTEGTTSLARRLISDLFGAAGGEPPTLLVDAVAANPTRLALAARDRRYLLGRGESCDVVLIDEAVSREHAVVVRRWDGITVADLGSRNGIRVNGAPVEGEHELSDGDGIQIGQVTLRLSDPESRYLTHLKTVSDGSPVEAARRPTRPTPLASVTAPALPAPTRDHSSVRRRVLIGVLAGVAFAAVAALAALLIAV